MRVQRLQIKATFWSKVVRICTAERASAVAKLRGQTPGESGRTVTVRQDVRRHELKIYLHISHECTLKVPISTSYKHQLQTSRPLTTTRTHCARSK
jgi:hypothetical protein